jgi:hypothetical protein
MSTNQQLNYRDVLQNVTLMSDHDATLDLSVPNAHIHKGDPKGSWVATADAMAALAISGHSDNGVAGSSASYDGDDDDEVAGLSKDDFPSLRAPGTSCTASTEPRIPTPRPSAPRLIDLRSGSKPPGEFLTYLELIDKMEDHLPRGTDDPKQSTPPGPGDVNISHQDSSPEPITDMATTPGDDTTAGTKPSAPPTQQDAPMDTVYTVPTPRHLRSDHITADTLDNIERTSSDGPMSNVSARDKYAKETKMCPFGPNRAANSLMKALDHQDSFDFGAINYDKMTDIRRLLAANTPAMHFEVYYYFQDLMKLLRRAYTQDVEDNRLATDRYTRSKERHEYIAFLMSVDYRPQTPLEIRGDLLLALDVTTHPDITGCSTYDMVRFRRDISSGHPRDVKLHYTFNMVLSAISDRLFHIDLCGDGNAVEANLTASLRSEEIANITDNRIRRPYEDREPNTLHCHTCSPEGTPEEREKRLSSFSGWGRNRSPPRSPPPASASKTPIRQTLPPRKLTFHEHLALLFDAPSTYTLRDYVTSFADRWSLHAKECGEATADLYYAEDLNSIRQALRDLAGDGIMPDLSKPAAARPETKLYLWILYQSHLTGKGTHLDFSTASTSSGVGRSQSPDLEQPGTCLPPDAEPSLDTPYAAYGHARNRCHDWMDYVDISNWHNCLRCCPATQEPPESWKASQSKKIPSLASTLLQLQPTPTADEDFWFIHLNDKPPNSDMIRAGDLYPGDTHFCCLFGGITLHINAIKFNPTDAIGKTSTTSRLLNALQNELLRMKCYISPLELAIQHCPPGDQDYTYIPLHPQHVTPDTALVGHVCHKFILPVRVTAFRIWTKDQVDSYFLNRHLRGPMHQVVRWTNPHLKDDGTPVADLPHKAKFSRFPKTNVTKPKGPPVPKFLEGSLPPPSNFAPVKASTPEDSPPHGDTHRGAPPGFPGIRPITPPNSRLAILRRSSMLPHFNPQMVGTGTAYIRKARESNGLTPPGYAPSARRRLFVDAFPRSPNGTPLPDPDSHETTETTKTTSHTSTSNRNAKGLRLIIGPDRGRFEPYTGPAAHLMNQSQSNETL